MLSFLSHPNIRILSTLPLGAMLFLFLGGWKLSIAYIVIWLDKLPLAMIYTKTGIDAVICPELVTIATIFVGMNYSLTPAFLFSFFVPLLLGSIKQFILPADMGSPFFVPSFQNFLDGLIAAIANLMKSHGLFSIMAVSMIVKHPLNLWFERIANPAKPLEINFISKIIFNLALASYMQGWAIFIAV